MNLEKPIRYQNKKYLLWVARMPCIAKSPQCIGNVSAHHVKSRKSGGDDLQTIPLCAFHHQEVHTIGRESFQKKYNIDFRDEIIKLLKSYIREITP